MSRKPSDDAKELVFRDIAFRLKTASAALAKAESDMIAARGALEQLALTDPEIRAGIDRAKEAEA